MEGQPNENKRFRVGV